MTIAFLSLEHHGQCVGGNTLTAPGVCETCGTESGSSFLPRHPALQAFLNLKARAIPIPPSLILLNGAWRSAAANSLSLWEQLQASLVHDYSHIPWQQAALRCQEALNPPVAAELSPIAAVIQAWECDHVRLIPYIHSQAQMPPLPWELFPPQWVKAGAWIEGVYQLYQCLFQAKQLLIWAHTPMALGELSVEILLQPGIPCLVSGSAQVQNRAWKIQAIPGQWEGQMYGDGQPDTVTLELPSLRLHSHRVGQHLGTSNLDSHYPPEPTSPLPQTPALNSEQLQQLRPLLKALLPATDTPPLQYVWQTPTGHSSAQLLACGPSEPASPPITQQVQLEPLGLGQLVTTGPALAPALVVTADETDPDFSSQAPGYLLVVNGLKPEWVSGLRNAAGLVCERGGLTSHGAILARELGRPAVIGFAQATAQIKTGDVLYLDGQRGQLSRVHSLSPHPSPLQPSRPQPQPNLASPPPAPCQLWVNLSQPGSLETITDLPWTGIGLLRSEMLFLQILEGRHPEDWFAQGQARQLQAHFQQRLAPIFAQVQPRPIFYRLLDLRTSDLLPLIGSTGIETPELNPELGLRGLSRACLYPDLLNLELKTLVELCQQYPLPLRLTLPFVRHPSEVEFCQDLISRTGLGQLPNLQLWVMAETPAMLFMLPELVSLGVTGISIGSNDLTQLLLGVDREHSHLSQQLNETHPAVKAALTQLIQTAKELGLACAICGEAVSLYPDWVDWLLGLGIDGISVNPDALITTWQRINAFQSKPTRLKHNQEPWPRQNDHQESPI